MFLLLLPLAAHTQELLRGKVVDAHSGTGISYATIGLIQQNRGTNANESGEFSIRCDDPHKDSLIISCIGYQTRKLPVSDLRSDRLVMLSKSDSRLPTIIVKDRWVNEELGSFNAIKNHYLTSNGYQSQIARKLTASVAGTWLRSVKLQSDRNGVRSRFRVRVYDINPFNDGPGNELTDTLIEVNGRGGLTTINLSSYRIWLPRKDFFVAIEWLHIPFNELKHYEGSKGSKTDYFFLYKPKICFAKETASRDKDIWYLNYSGFWTPMVHGRDKNGISIAATVSR